MAGLDDGLAVHHRFLNLVVSAGRHFDQQEVEGQQAGLLGLGVRARHEHLVVVDDRQGAEGGVVIHNEDYLGEE